MLAILALTSSISQAARPPSSGKYTGVAIFDRWGGCTLYSGVDVMYVSERVKQKLLPYKNKPIRVDATEISQSSQFGDGLIKKVVYRGPASIYPDWSGDGLRLKTFPAFKNGDKPSIVIEVINTGLKDLRLDSAKLAPTLLTKTGYINPLYRPTDGPSFALITGQGFAAFGNDKPVVRRSGVAYGRPYSWRIEKSQLPPAHFTLKPHQKKRIKIMLDVPRGEYDFLCGYNNGLPDSQVTASNLTAFDVTKGGKGKVVTPNR